MHAKLHTAKVVYDVLISILNALRIGGHPKLVSHFNSSLERAVKEAWQEQKEIGWDQICKGHISSKWDRVQAIYYGHNILLHDSMLYSEAIWMTKTVRFLLDFNLGLWNARWNMLYEADKATDKEEKWKYHWKGYNRVMNRWTRGECNHNIYSVIRMA